MSAAGRTYRQKRSGRLGWFHALLNRELEHRNTKADLAVLRLRFENECLEHQMAKGDIGRLRILLGTRDVQLGEHYGEIQRLRAKLDETMPFMDTPSPAGASHRGSEDAAMDGAG